MRLRSLRLRAMLVVCGAAAAPLLIIAFSDLENWPFRMTVAVIGSAAVMAWWLGWRMVRPLRSLQRQARERAATAAPGGGAPSEHALVLPRDDEFGDLAAAFNALLAALEQRTRANESFVADLVHEVKNPAAAVRAAAEALERGPADEARRERLARVLRDSSSRLDAVASRFLELARAEAGLSAEERTDVDLRALVEGLVREVSAAHPDVSFTATCVDARVFGVPSALESAVRNLLENAASFAPLGDGAAAVTVNLVAEGERAELSVSDSGPGIPAEDRERVFDRFFTRRDTGNGTGLGLALVRAVARSHGGDAVAVETTTGACLRWWVRR